MLVLFKCADVIRLGIVQLQQLVKIVKRALVAEFAAAPLEIVHKP